MPCMFRSVCRSIPSRKIPSSCLSRTSIQAPPGRKQTSIRTPYWNGSQCRGLHDVPIESRLESSHSVQPPSKFNPQAGSTARSGQRLVEVTSVPLLCPGCGALSQATNPNDAGYYSRSRKAVKNYLHSQSFTSSTSTSVLETIRLNQDALKQNGLQAGPHGTLQDGTENAPAADLFETPICDRCHNLVYNNQGTSIAHPTVEDLADSIAESPFRRNHVYHVLDAADFPMSLIPKIFGSLEVAKLRGQNRRARTKFTTKSTISFIITRSDLLGPSKEMVDKMMPYFQNLLRSGLGRQGRNTRLGNVHLVSAKRGWWTKELKDEIWQRGGGNWMVGKVNVGKSNLFPVLFPKGSGERAPVYSELQEEHQEGSEEHQKEIQHDTYLREDAMLPPAQPEVRFPSMPLVSHLPGTTASPIRLSFGQHKGELIDLPGLDRGSLEQHVSPDHKLDLVMQHRPNVQQHVIKAGQSLLFGGGLIRITPKLDPQDPSMTMLAYPFVPIDAHVTATEKAILIQQQQRDSGVKSILADGAGSVIKQAGTYALTTDITKIRAGPLLRAGVPLSKLPFRVFSSDVLIEGVGWVELVCQVQKTRGSGHGTIPTTPSSAISVQSIEPSPTVSPEIREEPDTSFDFKPFFEPPPGNPSPETTVTVEGSTFTIPIVEIFSPNGKHIGQRKPLGAWQLWEKTRAQRRDSKPNVRPRRSMKGSKSRAKMDRQESDASV